MADSITFDSTGDYIVTTANDMLVSDKEASDSSYDDRDESYSNCIEVDNNANESWD